MKKMKMILVVLVLVLVCTACGKDEDKSDEKEQNTVATERSEDNDLGEEQADSTVLQIFLEHHNS